MHVCTFYFPVCISIYTYIHVCIYICILYIHIYIFPYTHCHRTIVKYFPAHHCPEGEQFFTKCVPSQCPASMSILRSGHGKPDQSKKWLWHSAERAESCPLWSCFLSPDLSFPAPSPHHAQPHTPSGSWHCTCPWTGSRVCSRACSPSPGPWPAQGRRGTLCRQTSTRRQTVSQAQLG